MGSVIEAEGLRKSFSAKGRAVEAVRGVSLSVREGEIFGFLGPNGAGKTTTLRMLTTLMPIDSGSARVAGCDVTREPELVRARCGYVSQLGGSDELATGRENLVLQGRLYGGGKSEVKRRAEELIEALGLGGFAGRKVKTYSGGQRRRLDVAMGIVHSPTVLFLDEPTSGLDPQNRAGLWEQVRALSRQGTTVFLTTHYLEEADALCDRVTIIDYGEIVAEGAPSQLKSEVLGDSVTITVNGGAEELARALTVCEKARWAREASVEGDLLRLYVSDGASVLPDVLRLLDDAQISIASIGLAEPTLDDVFLAKTGRSLRDGEAGEQGGPEPGHGTGGLPGGGDAGELAGGGDAGELAGGGDAGELAGGGDAGELAGGGDAGELAGGGDAGGLSGGQQGRSVRGGDRGARA